MRTVQLVVVGGGVSGVAAARAAAGRGVQTVLVDEHPLGAAAYRRNVPYWFGPRASARVARAPDVYGWLEAHPELSSADAAGVELRVGCSVWGVFPDADGCILGLFDGRATELVRARAVILATGATDLHLAFPGWTLGGVLGGLGALSLLETSGYLEAQRLLVLGTSDLALHVAQRARAADIEVVGLVDVEPAIEGDPARAAELASIGVRFWAEHTIRMAGGGADVTEATLARVQGQRVLDGDDVTLQVDSVCVAIGRQPAIELASLAQCELAYAPQLGGFYVAHAPEGTTSQPGLFVAGDAGGTRDPLACQASGEHAGQAAADWLETGAHAWGGTTGGATTNVFASRWHALAESLAADDDADTLICRCEEVTRGEVLRALTVYATHDPNEIKHISRAGMGVCQGRGCRPLIAGLVAAHTQRLYAEVPLSSYRPPVRSVPLGALATEEGAAGPLLEQFGAANFTLPKRRAE